MQNKNNHRRPAGANKSMVASKRAEKKKNKSNVHKPKPWMMVIYWIMTLLMLFVLYLRVRHFLAVHW